jgi:hypothetical protein
VDDSSHAMLSLDSLQLLKRATAHQYREMDRKSRFLKMLQEQRRIEAVPNHASGSAPVARGSAFAKAPADSP